MPWSLYTCWPGSGAYRGALLRAVLFAWFQGGQR
jgi:hypothetical protein